MKKFIAIFGMGLFFLSISNTTNALPLVNGGFDDDLGLIGNSWGVFNSINGWTTGSGPGIEVQHSTVVDAETPFQYVELDSHNATDSNSSMYQTVVLLAGDYSLSWMYHARTNNLDDDNGIIAGVSHASAATIDHSFWKNSISSTYDAQLPDIWTQVNWTFTITNAGDYKLWFGAYGSDNTLGGFIDSVSLAPVPEPATMLLFGTGLVGLVGARFRRKK